MQPVESGGTIYPGLIELHNHISYNVLQLWPVPARYGNRDTWGNSPDYHRLVTAPMETLGEATDLLPALARYLEVKALVGGVTTTQGIALFSAAGIRRYYRGAVRNVEQTGDPRLPAAASRIADVAATDGQKFRRELHQHRCVLLHLSEGTDDAAHRHFAALRLADGTWAITDSLAGIHCVALRRADFELMAARGASMVWSPLSNLLLYGQTADLAAAKAARVRMGLGSDWSPSGSKSLFGELKVARLYSGQGGGLFRDDELLAMATTNAAEILRWDGAVGTLASGSYADLVVVAGDGGDPYGALFAGDERSVQLVVIDGEPRYGTSALMSAAGVADGDAEAISVGGERRLLNLVSPDPEVHAPTYAAAHSALADALENIKELRLEQERRAAAAPTRAAAATDAGIPAAEATRAEGRPRLALDEFEHTEAVQRPHLPLAGRATGPHDHAVAGAAAAAAAKRPLSDLLSPLQLDALTVADDPTFLTRIADQRNLPPWLAPGLWAAYAAR